MSNGGHASSCLLSERAIVPFYCLALAWANVRPCTVHITRVCRVHGHVESASSSSSVTGVETPGPHIEEVLSDHSDDSWDSVASDNSDDSSWNHMV